MARADQRRRRAAWAAVVGVLVVVLVAACTGGVQPKKAAAALDVPVPVASGDAGRIAGSIRRLDLHYAPEATDRADRAETLDAYNPAGLAPGALRPTVVWLHGGGWTGGGSKRVASELRGIADHGWTGIGLDYTLAPERVYPHPLVQIMEALTWIRQNAADLHVDPDRIVLAGDSAGGQLAAQATALITDPAYAKKVGVTPTLSVDHLLGTVLYCGVLDFRLTGVTGPFRTYLQRVLTTYTGTTRPMKNRRDALGSMIDHVSPAFPPVFLSAGNGDPLAAQSVAMAAKLRRAGVPVDTLFFPENLTPALPHEYELDTSSAASRLSMLRMLAFLDGVAADARKGSPASAD